MQMLMAWLSEAMVPGRKFARQVPLLLILGASTAWLREIREEVALQSIQAYVDVVSNRHLVRLANDNLRAHLLSLEGVRQRVSAGVSQRSDLQQVQGRIALAKSIITARAGKLREV